jgi:hypothetical protein
MKSKAGKEPEVGSKKRKEVGNEIALVSMFPKQQAVNDLNQSREAYNTASKGKRVVSKGEGEFGCTSHAFILSILYRKKIEKNL